MQADDQKPLPRLWLLCAGLGLLQAWRYRFAMNPDGIPYLELARAYGRGQWRQALNPYWSPLYSWLLAPALEILSPSSYWEFPLVHLMNFLIYLLALAAFVYLFGEFLAWHRWRDQERPARGQPLPDWTWRWIGYGLFLWYTLSAVTLSLVTPDLLVGGMLFLSMGLWLRLQRPEASVMTHALWGAVLGVSYLAKSFVWILGLGWIAAGFFMALATRRRASRYAISLVAFLLVAGPYVCALSKAKGRLTFGEAGKLVYTWCINKTPFLPIWQGQYPPGSVALHPTRLIMRDPHIYEFDRDVPASDPLGYDPSYWMEGVRPRLALSDYTSSWKYHAGWYSYLGLYLLWSLWVGALVLFGMRAPEDRLPTLLQGAWPLFVPGLAGLTLFALVAVEGRYVGPFVVFCGLGVFSSIRIPREANRAKWIAPVVFLTLLSPLFQLVHSMRSGDGMGVLPMPPSRVTTGPMHWRAAQALQKLGLKAGDRVATAGWSGDNYWAHIAGLRLVAKIPTLDELFSARPGIMDDIGVVLRPYGVQAIVAKTDSRLPDFKRWVWLAETPYSVFFLKASGK
jgi:hypothetical protein